MYVRLNEDEEQIDEQEDEQEDERDVAAAEKAEVEAKKKAEDEERMKAELEAKRLADVAAAEKAEAEAKKKAEDEERMRAEIEARRLADVAATEKAEAEAKKKADDEECVQAEIEARRLADVAAAEKAEAEAKKRVEQTMTVVRTNRTLEGFLGLVKEQTVTRTETCTLCTPLADSVLIRSDVRAAPYCAIFINSTGRYVKMLDIFDLDGHDFVLTCGVVVSSGDTSDVALVFNGPVHTYLSANHDGLTTRVVGVRDATGLTVV